MKSKIAATFSLLGILLFSLIYYWAYSNVNSLSNNLMYGVLEPLLIGLIFITIPFFVLIFLQPHITTKLLKHFTSWYVVLSAILITITPGSSHGFLPDPLDKEVLSWILGIIYLMISLGIIVYQIVNDRKKGGV